MGRLAENIEADHMLKHLNLLIPKLIEVRKEIDDTLNLIHSTLLILFPKTDKKIMEIIAHEVCKHYDIVFNDMATYNREGDVMKARHVYAAMAYKKCNVSFAKVGATISRDHSTVMNAVKVINNAQDTNDPLYFQYRSIELIVNDLISILNITKE